MLMFASPATQSWPANLRMMSIKRSKSWKKDKEIIQSSFLLSSSVENQVFSEKKFKSRFQSALKQASQVTNNSCCLARLAPRMSTYCDDVHHDKNKVSTIHSTVGYFSYLYCMCVSMAADTCIPDSRNRKLLLRNTLVLTRSTCLQTQAYTRIVNNSTTRNVFKLKFFKLNETHI